MSRGGEQHLSPGSTRSHTGASTTLTESLTLRPAGCASVMLSRGLPTCRWQSPRSGTRSLTSRPGWWRMATPISRETRSPRSCLQKREYAPQRCWSRSICLRQMRKTIGSDGRTSSSTRPPRPYDEAQKVIDQDERDESLQYSLQTTFLREG